MKYFLLFFIWIVLITEAKCQNTDTVITYLKNITASQQQVVGSLDSSDYFRITNPSGNADSIYDIKEFYKDGKVKFVGKFDLAKSINYHLNQFWLIGYCISYYPNGKKQDISSYADGKKDGLEYLYRPNGQLYCVKKNVRKGRPYFSKILGWECYDNRNNMICHDGNGEWLMYDPDFKNIVLSGKLKDGLPDGQWKGNTMRSDSIKFNYNFVNGTCKSSIGYDQAGVAYPFTVSKVFANYKYGGLVEFVKILRSRLSIPKDSNGNKINIDTVHFTFIVEKDGQMSNIEPCGKVNPALKEAIILAAKKCNNWNPTQYYGVPFRTKLVLSLNPTEGYGDNYYAWSIDAKGQVLDLKQSEPDLPHQESN